MNGLWCVSTVESRGDSDRLDKFLSPEATSAVPDKELYEWISVIVLS
eukprot:COSAG02_NODE_40351_length_406_cov_1.335505_1_plen_46_part_10